MYDSENWTLGKYLVHLRQQEGRRRLETGIGALSPTGKLTRKVAAEQAHTHESYLTKLELDKTAGEVSLGMLHGLWAIYSGTDAEWHYLCDLAGRAAPYPSLAGIDIAADMPTLEEFQAALTPIMLTEMDESKTDLVSFYTPQRRLIAANDAYYRVYPTHRPGIYMLEWTFEPEAKEAMINWDAQANLGVAWHRGLMGEYGHTKWAQEAHQRLMRFGEFRAKWDAGHVAYTLPLTLETFLRMDGQLYALALENWQMRHSVPIHRSRARLRAIPEAQLEP